jgi:hypothetical protein
MQRIAGFVPLNSASESAKLDDSNAQFSVWQGQFEGILGAARAEADLAIELREGLAGAQRKGMRTDRRTPTRGTASRTM